MIISLTIDEATSVLVAATAVRTQYEIESTELTSEAYLALKSGIAKLEDQLFGVKRDR